MSILLVQSGFRTGFGDSISLTLGAPAQVGNSLAAFVWGVNTDSPNGPPFFNPVAVTDNLNNPWDERAGGGSDSLWVTPTATGTVTVTAAVAGFPGGVPLFLWVVEVSGISRLGLFGFAQLLTTTGGSVSTGSIGPFVPGIPTIYFSAAADFNSAAPPSASSFVPIISQAAAGLATVVYARSATVLTTVPAISNTFSGADLDDVLQAAIWALGEAGPIPLTITCNNPPDAIVGTPYSHPLRAAGGRAPYTFARTAGTLPPGLLLGASTGVISGTPTTAGLFNFTVRVTDSLAATRSVACSINVHPAPAGNFYGTFVGFSHGAGSIGGGTT